MNFTLTYIFICHIWYTFVPILISRQKNVDVSFVNAHNMDTNGMENEDSRDETENVKRFPRKIFNIFGYKSVICLYDQVSSDKT